MKSEKVNKKGDYNSFLLQKCIVPRILDKTFNSNIQFHVYIGSLMNTTTMRYEEKTMTTIQTLLPNYEQ